MQLPFLKAIVMVWVGFALAGCNLVYSESPLFTAADTAGAPPLRQGVWAAPDDKCVFDQTRPSRRWPKCANRMVIDRRGLNRAAWKGQPEMLLAAGDPLVVQMTNKPDTAFRYLFGGARPTRIDARGRVIELATWIVQCGPPPPTAVDPSDAQPALVTPSSEPPDGKTTDSMTADGGIQLRRYVTLTPLPGLEVAGNNCLARRAADVRTAAKASEAWTATPGRLRWIRSGTR